MTYCTPKAVQEQILKRKLAASGCAVTLTKDRPVAATRRPALLDVPDDVLLTPSTLCVLFPFLALRPTQDGHCLMFAEFVLECGPPPYWGEIHEAMRPEFIGNDEGFCELVAEIIRQTHSR